MLAKTWFWPPETLLEGRAAAWSAVWEGPQTRPPVSPSILSDGEGAGTGRPGPTWTKAPMLCPLQKKMILKKYILLKWRDGETCLNCFKESKRLSLQIFGKLKLTKCVAPGLYLTLEQRIMPETKMWVQKSSRCRAEVCVNLKYWLCFETRAPSWFWCPVVLSFQPSAPGTWS